MSTTLNAAVDSYPRAKTLARGTRNEYRSTVRKWVQWGGGIPIEELQRKDVREFLDWVYERAVADQGTNPGWTVNKAREHLRAVLSWAWEQELIDAPPRFPKPRPQRDVAGRHYLTKTELNALYFATHRMRRPRGWDAPGPVGLYWRAALVVFFNYGLDTGTVWPSIPAHEPILWRHVSWRRQSPDRGVKEVSRWGWLFYRRVKTGKAFYRPMNRRPAWRNLMDRAQPGRCHVHRRDYGGSVMIALNANGARWAEWRYVIPPTESPRIPW